MPAKSKAQQKFMGMVYSTKKGKLKNPSDSVALATEGMSVEDVKDFASTKHDGLPGRVVEEEEKTEEKEAAALTALPVIGAGLGALSSENKMRGALLGATPGTTAAGGVLIGRRLGHALGDPKRGELLSIVLGLGGGFIGK